MSKQSPAPEPLPQDWHALSTEEALKRLAVDPAQGLSLDEVARRREQYGENRIKQQQATSPLKLFLLQFHQPLVYILLAAGLITLLLKEWVDAGVILGVVLVNALIGFIQEAKAVKAIEALSKSLSSSATVLREGRRRQIASEELVPGDIVFLQSGDKAPADLRLVQSKELHMDESALTGESAPVAKVTEALPAETLLADRGNMIYSSTLATYGAGLAVVAASGDATEIGRINQLIAAADVLATPLTKKIAHFSNLLLYIILGLAGVTFAVGVLRGESWLEMFMAVVALAVGAIPEGLPAAVTITLAIGVGKMAKRNAIIRKLPAVETLGGTTVIYSDKTGTLTQNQMTVQAVWAGNRDYAVSGIGYSVEGEVLRESGERSAVRNQALRQCLIAGLLCNDSSLSGDEPERRVEGDPTEAALLVSARKAGLRRREIEAESPRVDALPFESEHQYMATLHREAGVGRIYLKGAVERVLARCAAMLGPEGERLELDEAALHQRAEKMAAKGLRVLAFATGHRREANEEINHADVASGLIFLGLQGMIDPPRQEALESVRICQQAGIQVKMITGDHAVTAAAIAAELGLFNSEQKLEAKRALTGADLAALDEAQLIAAAEQSPVFARVAPEQKLRLVEALQAKGHVVAMTGDGVNDAPALRQADIGVAMGITGTEVAKEAADMLLTDDNFSSIEAAVEEGRGVYDNLVKFIAWTLPTNLGEGLVILAAVFMGAQLPILPVQILWINMTTAVLLGLMLAFEPKEPGLMRRAPRDPGEPLLSGPLMLRIALVGFLLLLGSFGLFEWELYKGSSLNAARTVAVNVFVFGEIFYLFNCRSLLLPPWRLGFWTNPALLAAVALMIILQMFFTYAPFMQRAFGSAAIGLAEWILILLGACFLFIVIELEKGLRRRSLRLRVE